MVSKGNCHLCGAELGSVAIKAHILNAHSQENGDQEYALLKIEGAYDKDYWLYVDVSLDKSLTAMDKFLRSIWLECRSHVRAFYGACYHDPNFSVHNAALSRQIFVRSAYTELTILFTVPLAENSISMRI